MSARGKTVLTAAAALLVLVAAVVFIFQRRGECACR